MLVVQVPEMRSAREVLLQKELELAKARKELEALRIVSKLLRDEEEWPRMAVQPTLTITGQSLIEAEAVIDPLHDSSSGRGRWRNGAKHFLPTVLT